MDGSLQLIATDEELGGLGDNDFVNNNSLLFTVLSESGEYIVYLKSDQDNLIATGAYTMRLHNNALSPRC